jgi:hypothetical protein
VVAHVAFAGGHIAREVTQLTKDVHNLSRLGEVRLPMHSKLPLLFTASSWSL